ncbi:MAG: uncharacterized protein QOD06_2195 [Candidatus Binatota bacterium]|nr:uncharacterized protein [Candidatus Binatota bacterium]
MTANEKPRRVHIVSHGPHCLDGVAAAAALARYYEGVEVRASFCGNPRIDEVLQSLDVGSPAAGQELWITDISWTRPETDAALRALAADGLRIFWIDHHRTATERLASGRIDVPFADRVVDERVSAARLVYEYLRERMRRAGERSPALERFERIVMMADDNDRWLHQIEGSWELALTLRSMNSDEAFDELLAVDELATYTPRMRAAWQKVAAEMERSFALAESTRTIVDDASGVKVVSAVCDGYPSEIADRWGREIPNAVFALFDLKGGGMSYRRSPDCPVDLSQVAKAFGGGGHPAAAGSQMPEVLQLVSRHAAERVRDAVRALATVAPAGAPQNPE